MIIGIAIAARPPRSAKFRKDKGAGELLVNGCQLFVIRDSFFAFVSAARERQVGKSRLAPTHD
jgi:hypothetical protein